MTEAVVQKCSVKKVFFEISQNSQENTCASVSFSIRRPQPTTLWKKKLCHRCFLVNFVKFLRTPFLIEHFWWLLPNWSFELVINSIITEAVVRRCCVKKVFLETSQNSQEDTCARVSFLIKFQAESSNFIKKETLAQVFSCEFCEISKNTFSHRTPLVIASVITKDRVLVDLK